MNYFFEAIGYIAGICTAICFIPQAWRTFRTKNVKGLSLPTYIIYNTGITCWIIYGAYLKSVQMIFFNVVSLCFALPILYLVIKYHKTQK